MKDLERQTYTGASVRNDSSGEAVRPPMHVPPFEMGPAGRIIFRGKSWGPKTGRVIKGTGRHGRDRGK